MSTLLVAAILIAGTVVVAMVFVYINRRNAEKLDEKRLHQFSHAGSANGLSFTSQEVLKDKIIGFDGLKQTFMVLEFASEEVTCIDLATVSNCTVVNTYDTVNSGNDKNSKIEKHLRSVDLRFSYKNSRNSTSVPFYKSSVNSIFEMADLEARAKGWESVLAKMILREGKVAV